MSKKLIRGAKHYVLLSYINVYRDRLQKSSFSSKWQTDNTIDPLNQLNKDAPKKKDLCISQFNWNPLQTILFNIIKFQLKKWFTKNPSLDGKQTHTHPQILEVKCWQAVQSSISISKKI